MDRGEFFNKYFEKSMKILHFLTILMEIFASFHFFNFIEFFAKNFIQNLENFRPKHFYDLRGSKLVNLLKTV